MHAAVALDFSERLDPRHEVVADATDAAELVEVAVVVGGRGAIGEFGLLVDGAIGGGADGNLQPVETLVDAERAAERGIDGIFRQAGLDVRAAGIVGGEPQPALAGEAGIAGNVETAVDMPGEIRPLDIDRRRRDGAVGRQRKIVAVAGEGAAQVGDNSMTLPVRHREKFRRDDIEQRA